MSDFFINHTKHFITSTTKDAKINIANTLCKTIRDNQWSICDNIEFVELLHCTPDKKYKIKMLIDNEYYYCSYDDALWFSF